MGFYHTVVLGLFKKLESDKNVVDYSKFGVNETSEYKAHCETFTHFFCVLNKRLCIFGFKVVLSLCLRNGHI